MKRLIVLLAAAFVAACGGGSASSDTAASPSTSPDTLPDIVDLHDDGIFMYADPSLYRGDYTKTSTPEDTCSAAFGEVMPTNLSITSISTTGVVFTYDGLQETHPYISQDLSDLYAYDGLFSGVACVYGVTSVNNNGQTYDRAIMYCEDLDSYLSCVVAYQRDAAYDFTSRTIKSGDVNSMDAIKGIIELE